MLIKFFVEKFVKVRVLLNFLLPWRSFEILDSVNHVLEIVERKDTGALENDEFWDKVHFHVYFRGQSYSGPFIVQWDVFDNKKLVFESDILSLFRDFKVITFLVYLILIDGF